MADLPPPDEDGWANDIAELVAAEEAELYGEPDEDDMLAELARLEGME